MEGIEMVPRRGNDSQDMKLWGMTKNEALVVAVMELTKRAIYYIEDEPQKAPAIRNMKATLILCNMLR